MKILKIDVGTIFAQRIPGIKGFGKFSLRLIGFAMFGATFTWLHASECRGFGFELIF